MSEELKNKIQLALDIANPGCSKGYDHDTFVAGSRALKRNLIITKQHAYSLGELVKHYKKMIVCLGKGNCELTAEYCDELLKDLEEGD